MNEILIFCFWLPVERKRMMNNFGSSLFYEYYRKLEEYISGLKKDMYKRGYLIKYNDKAFGLPLFSPISIDIDYCESSCLRLKRQIKFKGNYYSFLKYEFVPYRKSLKPYNVCHRFIHVILPEFVVVDHDFFWYDDKCRLDGDYPYTKDGFMSDILDNYYTNRIYKLKKAKRYNKRYKKIYREIYIQRIDNHRDIYYDEENDMEIDAREYCPRKLRFNKYPYPDFYYRIDKEKSWKYLTKDRKQYLHNL